MTDEWPPWAADLSRRLFGRTPRFRYFEDKGGRCFVWTTERMGDGKFASAVLVPYGPGSRSGKAKVTRWRTTREVHHATRRAARARALLMYEASR